MKAPASSPTKFPLPQFRFKRVTMIGLGFLLASCRENLTQPTEHLGTPDLSRLGASPDIVVMERTTTDAADVGKTAVVRTSREVLTPQVRIAGRSSLVRASTSSGTTTPPGGLPRPPLSLPARREVGICNALPAWTERTKGANGRDLLLAGVGDAPASSIKITQDDGSVWNVQRSWTRTATSWQLDRQVTSGSRGYHDIVAYRHENSAGQPVNNALPVSTCTGQQPLVGQASLSASHSFYPAYSGALYSKLVPGSGVSADDGCWDNFGDPCYDKRISVYKSDLALIGYATAMTLACVSPATVLVIPCVAATSLYFIGIANLALDQAALQNCIAEAAQPKGNELSVGIDAASTLAASPTHAALSVAGIGATTLNDCGSSSASSGTHCQWATFEISYDGGETWNYFASFLLCDNAS
jgi:hypothetical protein